MPWVRFADDYLFNPKIATLTLAARMLDVSAIIYSARELRDGQLSHVDVQVIAAAARIRKPPTDELVQAGRWETTHDGYAIHDYLAYQPSREQVLAERASLSAVRAAAGSAGGQASAQAKAQAKFKQTTQQNRSNGGSKIQAPDPDPDPVNPDPDPGPPRTPPDEQGGRWSARRGRRRDSPHGEPTPISPQDERELWCPEHTGHFRSECSACRQIEQDFVTLTLSRIPR